MLTQGYWRQPALTRAAFVDGWLRTGDCGRMTAEGCLFIVDRLTSCRATLTDTQGRLVAAARTLGGGRSMCFCEARAEDAQGLIVSANRFGHLGD